jgi:hypothetical protein
VTEEVAEEVEEEVTEEVAVAAFVEDAGGVTEEVVEVAAFVEVAEVPGVVVGVAEVEVQEDQRRY